MDVSDMHEMRARLQRSLKLREKSRRPGPWNDEQIANLRASIAHYTQMIADASDEDG